jgi:hypothetical protein
VIGADQRLGDLILGAFVVWRALLCETTISRM